MPIVPDTKNWTWVLDTPCPDCGYDAAAITVADVPALVRANAAAWPSVLTRADVAVRPDENTWSPLEYAAHVRDVFRIFEQRLRLILTEDVPRFENWDQDATAIEERYSEQDPATVSAQLTEAASVIAAAFEAVPADAWQRRGLRGDGAEFSTETLAKYFIHDPLHHLWDVRERRSSVE